MNKALRGGDLSSLSKSKIKNLESCISALNKYSSPRDMVVRRGSNLNSLKALCGVENVSDLFKDPESLKGKVAQDEGFLSTSLLPGKGFTGLGVEYQILVPQGSKAPYIEEYSLFKGKRENEVLIAPGGVFRVIEAQVIGEGKSIKVWMEYLGSK